MARLPSERHEKFARSYVQHDNVYRAARVCEITPNYGEKLVRRPEVKARIVELRERMLKMADINAQRVMLELARVGFSDIRQIYDERGALKPIHEIDADTAAGIAGMEFEEKFIREVEEDLITGEPVVHVVPIRTVKIKRYDKNPALLTLAKHFKIVGDEGDGVNALASALADRLNAARKRIDVVEMDQPKEISNESE
jgi:phage terminase small subunit